LIHPNLAGCGVIASTIHGVMASVDLTICPVPGSPVLEPPVTVQRDHFTSVRLAWSHVDTATSYHVYHEHDGGIVKCNVTTGTTVEMSITTGGMYSFWVTAANTSTGEGLPSNVVTAIIDVVSLNAPVISIDSFSTSTWCNVTITWNAIDAATSYVVYRNSGGGENYAILATTNKTSCPDAVPENARVYYKVKATRGAIESEFSNILSIMASITSPGVPVATVNEPVSTSGYFVVSWNPVENMHQYVVYIDTVSNVEMSVDHELATVNDTSCDGHVDRNGTYYLVVVAVDGIGRRGSPSNAVNITVSLQPAPDAGIMDQLISWIHDLIVQIAVAMAGFIMALLGIAAIQNKRHSRSTRCTGGKCSFPG
jgi:fibronectin type 3 domain-containing protein